MPESYSATVQRLIQEAGRNIARERDIEVVDEINTGRTSLTHDEFLEYLDNTLPTKIIEPKSVEDILKMNVKDLNGCTITKELIHDICKRIKSLEQSEKHKGDFV